METKQVIGQAILAQSDRPFRSINLQDDTGLSKQLIGYHLDRLVKAGLLRKNGARYQVIDKGLLLEHLVSVTGKQQEPFRSTFFFSQEQNETALTSYRDAIYALICANELVGKSSVETDVLTLRRMYVANLKAMIEHLNREITAMNSYRPSGLRLRKIRQALDVNNAGLAKAFGKLLDRLQESYDYRGNPLVYNYALKFGVTEKDMVSLEGLTTEVIKELLDEADSI